LLPNARLGIFHTMNYMINTNLKLFEDFMLGQSIYDKDFETDLEFLHFTSIPNLLNILKSQTLRMSDLNYMEDKEELNFACKNLNDKNSEDRFWKLKSSIFSLSLCDYSEKILFDKEMWMSYGRKRRGACIKLKIHHSKRLPLNYYINNIIYHPESPIKELNELRERHDDFKKEHGWAIKNLDECLNILCSFYKRESFRKENESRLVRYIRLEHDETHDEDLTKIGVNVPEGHSRFTYYYDLQLNSSNTRDPLVTIEKIFVGDKIDYSFWLRLEPIFYKLLKDEKKYCLIRLEE